MLAPETEVVIQIDGAEAVRHLLRPGEYVLGRAVDADLRVEADLVSRRHARLTINYDHALIEDLGSSNGTFINGKPVTGSTRLWPGQRIEVGSARIELRRRSAEADPDVTLPPAEAALQRLLPEDLRAAHKYAVGGVVAQGGMGAILDAREAALRRTVAMKVMLDTRGAEDVARFVEEAQVTGQLEHPNIVPVHELGVDENGQPFYTMKMVRGISLKKVLDLLAAGVPETQEKYPLSVRLTIFQKVCDGIAFAHSKRVIHRDLKPENIMLGEYGEALVMDWGLAKVLAERQTPNAKLQTPNEIMRSAVMSVRAEQGASGSTQAGTILGTPQYMSPEQANGEVETLDTRTDIYALGAILFHLIELRPPVTGATVEEVLEKVRRGDVAAQGEACVPPRHPHLRAAPHTGARRWRRAGLRDGRPSLDSLAAVVRKAMALRPEDRYPSVQALQADIAAYQAGFATSAENASLLKQAWLLVQRHRAVFATAFAAWLVITAMAVWFVLNLNAERRHAERERERAEQEKGRAEAGEQRAEETLGLVNQHLLRVKLEKAREAFDSDRADEGLAWLAAVLRQDPQNRFAPAWLLSALTERNFPIPAAPSIVVERAADAKDESNTLVRFSPDGRRVFFNSGYNACGVWDVATGRPVWPELLRANVGLAEFTPDGKAIFLKELGRNGTQTHRREAETGKLLGKTEPPHGAEIARMALSPEGTLLATGDPTGEIRVWDAHTLAPLGDPLRTPRDVLALAISADDRWLAARAQPSTTPAAVYAWDLRTRQPAIEPLTETQGETLRFHPASSVLLVGGVKSSPRPYLVDLADGRRVEAKDRHIYSNPHPTFSPDGARFATGGVDDRARVWDTHSGAPITPWMQHGGDVAPPQFSPEGLRLFTASFDQYCRLWDARTGRLLAEPWRLPGAPLNPTECRLSPDGTLVATPARRRSLQLWDVRDGRELPFHVVRRDGSVLTLSFSPDGTRLLESADRSEVRVHDTRTGAPVFGDLVHAKPVYATAFSPDGKWIATGSEDFTARLWNAQTGKPVSPPLAHEKAVKAVTFSPDSRLLATGGFDRFVRLWKAESGEPVGAPIFTIGNVLQLNFSPDGRLLAAATQYGTTVIELPAGKVVAQVMRQQPTPEAIFSPDGTRLAIATSYDGVQVVDTARWEPVFAPLPHDNAVNTVRFSPDGARLLSASADGTARLWDAWTGEALTPPLRHGSAVRVALFSPDDGRVATATTGGEVRLWDAQTGQPLSEPLRQPLEVNLLAFTPDGKRLAFRGVGSVGLWDVPPPLPPAPPWLAGLAEAVAGRRVDERGELVPVQPIQFWFFRERLAAGGGSDPYARWAAWFFADRATRAASPWREAKLADEIARLDKEGGDAGRLAILRHQPTHVNMLDSFAGGARSWVKQTQLEADAETLFAVAVEARVKEALANKRAANVPAYTTGAGPRGFPLRDAACTARQLDLTRHYTHLLDLSISTDGRTHFGALPLGLTTLDGIAWDLRGLAHIFGEKTARALPVRIEGIPVGQRFTRLHALQTCTGARSQDGTLLGHYVLRYKDGQTRELPIAYGEDLRNWDVGADPTESKHAREAWRGKAGTLTVRLFHRTYENPRPDAEVAALDLISAKADAGPFVVAITVE